MKLGDIIDCANEEDLKKTLRDLGLAGFQAMHDSAYGRYALRIAGVPETQYLVQAVSEGRGVQRAYCDTQEEAEAAAEWLGQSCEFVEILKGYPGEWETVSQSW